MIGCTTKMLQYIWEALLNNINNFTLDLSDPENYLFNNSIKSISYKMINIIPTKLYTINKETLLDHFWENYGQNIISLWKWFDLSISSKVKCYKAIYIWLTICISYKLWSYDAPFMRHNRLKGLWHWFDL